MRVCVCVRERVCVCEGVRVYMYRCVGMCGSHGYCKAYKRKLWLGEASLNASLLCCVGKVNTLSMAAAQRCGLTLEGAFP